MFSFIIFITLTAIIAIVALLSINTSRNKANAIDMEVDEFESMLEKEGLSKGIVDFCLHLIRAIQQEIGDSSKDIISHNVLSKLNGWDYSSVLDEKDYEHLYSQHSSEINRIHQNIMDDQGFLPSDVGESKHTESWSKDAQYAEMAITQKISDVVNRYKRKNR